ncbi:MAG TPA: GtrA family protein [Chromatiales bacterium]|nr:GtrA family protein [Chromatiales bacterium]
MPWKKTSLQPLRFALSGGLSTAAHWLVMGVMINAGTLPAVATATGALIGAIVNYVLQRHLTFQSSALHRTALPRYLSVCTVTWVANLLFFLLLHRIFLLSPMVAQGATTVAIALMSYFLYKRIVFNDRQTHPVFQE